jgi:hypothetical protein
LVYRDSLLLFLLLLDLFLHNLLLLLALDIDLLVLVVALVVVVAWMVLLELPCVEVEVVDVAPGGPARLPLVGQRRLEALFRDVEQVSVLLQIHAQVLRILLDFLKCRLILFIQLLLHYLETLPK